MLTYNLGRLFNLPIFVDKNNFMLDEEHKLLFPQVNKITASVKRGIFDIGANIETRYTKKFIHNAKLIIIPFEYGYESMTATIQTLKYIEYASSRKIPTLLILNRLDRTDQDRDFNYTSHMKEKFNEEGISFGNVFEQYNESNIYLTYLRNSYSIQSNLEYGEYFLDKMYNQNFISEELNNLSEFRTKAQEFEYKFFINIAQNIISRVDYENEEIYRQDKDMVVFRNNYSEYVNRHYEYLTNDLEDDLNKFFMRNKGVQNHISLSNLINGNYIEKEKKLLKDMAYIGFLVDVLYSQREISEHTF
ncbi:MAG: hypothetical protein L3J10_05075 [Sulfurimonas sp.]|nr:hypothetical protein [Sulfurimonas sp.]